MIRTFKDKDTEAVFNRERCSKFANIARAAYRKLKMIDYAASLVDLKIPPGNKLEPLKKDRQ